MKSFPILLPLFLLSLVSCRWVDPTPPHEINELYRDVLDQRDTQYLLKPGDSIQLRFYNPPVLALDQFFSVLSDGRADPYFMDNAIVAGKTLRQLEDEVRLHYSDQIESPEIILQVTMADERVYLEGHAANANPTNLKRRMTLSQLLADAGGYQITASADSVLLVRPYWNPDHPDRFRVSLYDDSEEIFLLPNDHIVVEPTTWILLRDYFVEYIAGLVSPAGRYQRQTQRQIERIDDPSGEGLQGLQR